MAEVRNKDGELEGIFPSEPAAQNYIDDARAAFGVDLVMVPDAGAPAPPAPPELEEPPTTAAVDPVADTLPPGQVPSWLTIPLFYADGSRLPEGDQDARLLALDQFRYDGTMPGVWFVDPRQVVTVTDLVDYRSAGDTRTITVEGMPRVTADLAGPDDPGGIDWTGWPEWELWLVAAEPARDGTHRHPGPEQTIVGTYVTACAAHADAQARIARMPRAWLQLRRSDHKQEPIDYMGTDVAFAPRPAPN